MLSGPYLVVGTYMYLDQKSLTPKGIKSSTNYERTKLKNKIKCCPLPISMKHEVEIIRKRPILF